MATLFLQDSEATILLADILDFSTLAKTRNATIELAITLTRFYEHVAAAAKSEGGRVIKLCGDGVLCAFVGVADHQLRALRALRKLVDGRDAHNEGARKGGMPEIDYTVVLGSGRVLAGDLGAEKLQGFDVIGATVNRVFRLSHVATKRKVSHLIEASTYEAAPAAARQGPLAAAPVEAANLDGESVSLYALSS
jgi:class 3 adenylate cyclase